MTAAVSDLAFIAPVKVGDAVCCYTELRGTGRSSMRLGVEVWVLRGGQGDRMKVTEAVFSLVAVDAAGKPRALPPA